MSDKSPLSLISRVNHYFQVYYRLVGKFLYLFVFLGVLGAAFEVVGVSLFAPLIELALNQEVASETQSNSFYQFLSFFDLEPTVAIIAVFILFVISLKALFLLFQVIVQNRIVASLKRDLREQTLDLMCEVDYQYFLKHQTGFLNNLLIREVNVLASGFLTYSNVLSSFIMLTVYMVGVTWIDWRIAVGTVLLGFLTVGLFKFVFTKSRHYSAVVTSLMGKLQNLSISLIESFHYLKGTNGFHQMKRSIKKENDDLVNYEFRQNVLNSFFSIISEPIAFLLAFLYIYFASKIQGLQATTIVPVLYLLYRSIRQVSMFQALWQKFESITGSIDLMNQKMQRLREHVEVTGKTPYSKIQDKIHFEHVSLSIEGKNILSDISLDIPKNKIVGLIGESGSGKSISLSLLLGLFKPSSGKILIDNKDLSEIDLASFRSQVGYVSQKGSVFYGDILSNVIFDDERDSYMESDVEKVLKEASFEESLKRFDSGLMTKIGMGGQGISGGEAVRIHLARELLKNADLLILDETTSQLDIASEKVITQTLLEQKKDKTIIVVAHRMSLMEHVDYLYVFQEGQIIEDGRPSELIRNKSSQFYDMVKKQQIELKETTKV